MNKHNKGTRFELQARKILEAEGYLVEKKNYNRWASKDFFNLFDILAIHPTGEAVIQEVKEGDVVVGYLSRCKIRLIQIKTNVNDFYKSRRDIQAWVNDKKISGIDCEVWLKEPRKAWRKEIMTPQDASQPIIV